MLAERLRPAAPRHRLLAPRPRLGPPPRPSRLLALPPLRPPPPSRVARLAAEYASFFSDAGIVGAADYNSGKGSADNVGVKATDDNTLQIQLESPSGYFPNLAALWVVPPLRQDIIQKAGDAWAQDASTYIGNGPFKMTEWVHQDHITLA